jgi:hypothetical protein
MVSGLVRYESRFTVKRVLNYEKVNVCLMYILGLVKLGHIGLITYKNIINLRRYE